jgi:hypothetical protein
MEKEFIPYELALELKQLGFKERCLGYYIELVNPNQGILTIEQCDKNIDGCLAPTYAQAFRWFRKEHALESYIRANLFVDVPKSYQFYIDENIDDIWYDTYEEAEIACLKKLIEIVNHFRVLMVKFYIGKYQMK